MPLEHVEIGDVVVERHQDGRPHQGKVLAAIQAHADDIPFYCAGTVAKLIDEGYTAYLIQTTNDEKCGPTRSLGETILANEREVEALGHTLGFRQVFHLGYRNHLQDEAAATEMRARFIYLIRTLKIDTVLTFNPWGVNEENPDHYVTGRAVEAACWMAGMDKDYPEQVACGLQPHGVREKYYWVVRPGQPCNLVVDISPYVGAKVAAMAVNKTQGPAGAQGRRLKRRLAAQGRHLPALDGDDEAADRAYIRLFGLEEYREVGQRYGAEYGERFYYVGHGGPFEQFVTGDDVERYVDDHAVPLGA
ncbi:MAG: PIG-L deacetylase family protein [Candidatus Latescibacterota bacterium]